MVWSRCRFLSRTSSSPGRSRWSTASFLLLLILFLASCGADDPAEGQWNTYEPENQSENDDQENQGNQEDPLNQDDEPPPPKGDPEIITAAIETVLRSPNPMRAGDKLDVECRFLDQSGEVIKFEGDPPRQRILHNPNDAFIRQGADMVAAKAGRAFVTCQSPILGLTDPNPVEVTIKPGDVHTVTTTLDDHQISAGTSTFAQCEAFDAFGNPVEDAPFTILADQTGPGIVIDNDEKKISLTTAGLYTFSCHVEGTTERFGRPLEVLPAPPAELLVALVPHQTTYGIGQVITLATLVQDQFGNQVPNAHIAFAANPAGENFGQGRFRFNENGVYTLSAHVTSPTLDDRVLYEEIDVIVHGSGPTIQCSAPLDNSMVDHSPGSSLLITGTAQHELGVDQVFVDGVPVTLNQDGTFSATITPRYGMNFVDVVAIDTYGEESVRTCTFLVANRWVTPSNDFIDDAIALRLSQDAIDSKSGGANNTFTSLNDMILAALNSDGLRQTLLESLQANQPYDVDMCSFDLKVRDFTYEGNEPHITSIDLISGGLRLKARLNGLRAHLRIEKGSGINPFCWANYEPRAHVKYVELQLTSDIGLSGNTPSLTLRNVEHVKSGKVEITGGNWLSSALYSALDSLFQGTLVGLIEDTFENAVGGNFDDIFNDLLGSLDIDSLSGTVDVPRLDSDNTIGLNFGFRFSYLNATSARLLFGLAPRMTHSGPAATALPTKGVPYPSGTVRHAPSGDSATAGVHISLLNQALHSLWRGGLLHADIASTLFGEDVPDGTDVRLEAQLPPMVVLDGTDNDATVMLGGLRFSIQYPGLFDDPVNLTLGATATTSINLENDELSFDDVTLDEFHLSPDEISLNEESRDILEDFLRDLLQKVVDQSLNAALPALPIPSFTISPTMAQYGLPLGREIGVVNPEMDSNTRHITLRGQFGLR